jgi:Na+/melibiose symporter-like transporter
MTRAAGALGALVLTTLVLMLTVGKDNDLGFACFLVFVVAILALLALGTRSLVRRRSGGAARRDPAP